MKLVVLLAVLAWSQPARAERLEVTARVAEIPPKLGICGVRAIRAVIRYEVIAVTRGSHAAKDVHVVVTCPERFRAGMKHRLVLVPAPPSGHVDRFPAAAPRYRATTISPAT